MSDLHIIKEGGIVHRQLKDVDRAGRVVGTYYAVFDNLPDSDDDIAMPGMTLKTIKERGPGSAKPRIKNFLNHDVTRPLGLPIEMGEDAIGAFGRAKIGEHNDGVDFLKMADAGLITEASYMLNTIRRDKGDRRKQLEVVVHEWSNLTHWGANGRTFIYEGITKSMGKEGAVKFWLNKIDAIEKFCRNTDATDECITALILQIKMLGQFIVDLTTTTAAGEAADDKKADGTTEEPGTQELGYKSLLDSINSIKFE